jgi:glycosyltransferase involved in cell wall biosynthesis
MIGGHPQQLARAERALGLESWSVAFRKSKFQYPTDEILWQDHDSALIGEVKRWGLLARCLWQYDIVHFNFGQSLLPARSFPSAGSKGKWNWLKNLYALLELRDLPLLKWAGKGIAMTFQGDDARQGDFLQQLSTIDLCSELEPGYYSAESDAHKKKRLAHIAHYANCIYALNPDLLHVLPAGSKFLPYAHLDLEQWPVVPPNPVERPPVVLHAPTHRGIKGTRHVLAAVNRLRDEGIPFDFQLVENRTWTEARALYEKADLLVDQLLLGWYGGLAVEMMALGKPVICYLREGDLGFIPLQMRKDLPIIQADPASLYSVLKEWLTVRRAELIPQGRRSRAFVESWHDPREIASQVASDYRRILGRAA